MNQKSSMETLSQMFCSGTMEQIKTISTLGIDEKNVLEKLAMAGLPFSWETVKEVCINNDANFTAIEVRLYISGCILYGRNVYCTDKIESCQNAHYAALYDAIKPLLNQPPVQTQTTTESVKTAPMQTQKSVQPLSNDEIMNIVQQQAAAKAPEKITTAEQFQNDTRSEIPFEDVNLTNEEFDKLLSGNVQQPTSQPQQASRSMGFTQDQIQRMKTFKQNYNITTDIILGSYINAWNNKLSKKEDLNSSNIESFLEWTNLLGKAPL